MSAPAVSIVFTTYNVLPYVRASLDSICAQTLQDIQIIVVDDGSTDGTVDVLREYAARDSRIDLNLFEKNTPGGVARAANAGLDMARGDYVGFADGDDLYDPAMFETLLRAARRLQADYVICDYQDFDSDTGKVIPASDKGRWKQLPPEDLIFPNAAEKRILLALSPAPWRKLYRRSFLQDHTVRFPEVDHFFEDNPFHWKTVLNAQSIVLVREILCYHRLNRVGQTMTKADFGTLAIFNHFEDLSRISHEAVLSDASNDPTGLGLKPELLRWVLGHVYWCGAMVGVAGANALITAVHQIATSFTPDDVLQALDAGAISDRDVLLYTALVARDKGAVLRVLDGRPPTVRDVFGRDQFFNGTAQALKGQLSYIVQALRGRKPTKDRIEEQLQYQQDRLAAMERRRLLMVRLEALRQMQRR